MSGTSKKPVAEAKTTAKDKAKSVFKHLQESANNRWKKIPAIAKMIIFAIIAASLYAADKGGTAQYAMLYMIADNAKKSGRADGNVYMRNGVIRGMRVPSLVQNNFTQLQRGSLSQLSSSWNALTQDQMNSWNNASGFFASDRFGRSIEIKGKALYVRLNQNLFNSNSTLITVAPVPTSVNGITNLSFVADDSGNTFILTFTPTPTDADVKHLIFATAQLSAGTFRPSKSAFRLIGLIPIATATGVDIQADYVAKFGLPVTGNKIFIKLIPVNRVTGQAGPAIVASSVVIA